MIAITNNNIVMPTVIKIIVCLEMSATPGINVSPSTEERILIAGVITPSPKRSDTPR